MAWFQVTAGGQDNSSGSARANFFPVNNNNFSPIVLGDLIIVGTYFNLTVTNVSDPSNGNYTLIAQPLAGISVWYVRGSQPFASNSLKITATFGGGTSQGLARATVWRGGYGSLNHFNTGSGTSLVPSVSAQNDTAGNLLYMWGGFFFNALPTPQGTGLGDCSFGSIQTTSSADTGNLGFNWVYMDEGEVDLNVGLRPLGCTITNTSAGSMNWTQVSVFFNTNTGTIGNTGSLIFAGNLDTVWTNAHPKHPIITQKRYQ